MSRRRPLVLALSASLAVAAVLALQASGKATVAVSCGDVITSSITVDNDLTNCAGDGLVVGAAGITINLNGHTIDGDDAGDQGIDNGGGFDNVKVLNGKITDFEQGVWVFGGAEKNQLTALEIRSNETGIYVSFSSNNAMIKNNRVLFNTDDGILVDSSGTKIEANRVVSNTDDGIAPGSGNQVTKNVIARNGDDGVAIHNEDGTQVSHNVIAANGDSGVFISDGATGHVVQQNRITNNAGGGVVLDAHSAPGNTVQQNALLGNATGLIVSAADGNVLKQNEVYGSDGDGIFVDDASENTVIDGNLVSANTVDGIDVNDADGGTLIKRNTADANGDRGIEAVSGIDGGANKAAGNVNATQCQVVVCS